jgi:hypothetical protein
VSVNTAAVLRPLEDSDWEAVQAWAVLEQVYRYQVWGLLHRGFTVHGRHRIFATCDPRNLRSAAVLRRLGMTYEGRLREDQLIRDGWRDSDIYSVLVHEWNDPGSS